jgi:transposase
MNKFPLRIENGNVEGPINKAKVIGHTAYGSQTAK